MKTRFIYFSEKTFFNNGISFANKFPWRFITAIGNVITLKV